MSERISLQEILKDYGVPLASLDVVANRDECVRLRDHLKKLTDQNQQAYLEVQCSFYIDIHDIDRYLRGELPNLAAIYTFPDDVKVNREGE